jgi:hypothetical protein
MERPLSPLHRLEAVLPQPVEIQMPRLGYGDAARQLFSEHRCRPAGHGLGCLADGDHGDGSIHGFEAANDRPLPVHAVDARLVNLQQVAPGTLYAVHLIKSFDSSYKSLIL